MLQANTARYFVCSTPGVARRALRVVVRVSAGSAAATAAEREARRSGSAGGAAGVVAGVAGACPVASALAAFGRVVAEVLTINSGASFALDEPPVEASAGVRRWSI